MNNSKTASHNTISNVKPEHANVICKTSKNSFPKKQQLLQKFHLTALVFTLLKQKLAGFWLLAVMVKIKHNKYFMLGYIPVKQCHSCPGEKTKASLIY